MKERIFILDTNTIGQMDYELVNLLFPMNTVLEGDIFGYIDEIDPTFRNRYSWFFDNKDPKVDNTSVDGVLDWLYGYCHFLSKSSKEYLTFKNIIKNIEKHEIGGKENEK